MTISDQGADRPGGTALLGGRTVARMGYGAMQLPGPACPALPATGARPSQCCVVPSSSV